MTQQTRAVLAFALAQLRPESRLLAVATFWRVLFRLLPVQAPLLAGALIDGLWPRAPRPFFLSVPRVSCRHAASTGCANRCNAFGPMPR